MITFLSLFVAYHKHIKAHFVPSLVLQIVAMDGHNKDINSVLSSSEQTLINSYKTT